MAELGVLLGACVLLAACCSPLRRGCSQLWTASRPGSPEEVHLPGRMGLSERSFSSGSGKG